jgi:hypothetical protein
LGVGPAVVLEEGLVAAIHTGNLERGRGLSGIAAGDLDVRTPDVELAVCVRLVRGRLFDTDEVLAGGDLGGHLEGELLHLPGNPVAIGGRAGPVTPLGNLEPVAGSVVVADVAGGLGHVDLFNAWMISFHTSRILPRSKEVTSHSLNYGWGSWYLDRSRVVETVGAGVGLEADGILSSGDFGGLGLAHMVRSPFIATKIIALKEGAVLPRGV